MILCYAEAIAKVILCGEHAVVYGIPAIAIPVSALKVSVEVYPVQDNLYIHSLDTHEMLIHPDANHPYIRLVTQVLMELTGTVLSLGLSVRSQIPVSSGLGSGAAVATALVRAVYHYLERPLDNAAINRYVFESEKSFHGSPSGIDNTVIVYEQPLYFVKNSQPKLFSVSQPLHFLVADTGKAASTRETVATVRTRYQIDKHGTTALFNRIGIITDTVLNTLQTGDVVQLGALLTENHHLLQQLGVSCVELDHLVNHALEHGAYGAKLSGGGGGGNMIALASPEKIVHLKQALLSAGATRVIHTVLKT